MGKMIEELQEGISRLSAENTRLEELNREMVSVLELMVDDRNGSIIQDGSILQVIILNLLAKAEEGMSK